jgi:hypothetical protein
MSVRSNEARGAPRGSRRDVLIGAAAMATAPLIASGSAAAQPTTGSAPASPANRRDRRRDGRWLIARRTSHFVWRTREDA